MAEKAEKAGAGGGAAEEDKKEAEVQTRCVQEPDLPPACAGSPLCSLHDTLLTVRWSCCAARPSQMGRADGCCGASEEHRGGDAATRRH